MEQFVGLDVSQKLTHVCVVDQKGSVVWRGTCLSTPEDIAATVRAKAPDAVRIGLETGPLSTWHWHALKAMGLPVPEGHPKRVRLDRPPGGEFWCRDAFRPGRAITDRSLPGRA